MKKIIVITAFLVICLSGFTQRGFKSDSIRVPDGADTTVYWLFWTEKPWGLSIEYKDFDDTDATFNLGESGNTFDGTIFNQIDSDALPYTMADSTQGFEKMSHNFRYLAMVLTKNSVTAGLYMRYTIHRSNPPSLVAMNSIPGEIEYLVDSTRLYALKD